MLQTADSNCAASVEFQFVEGAEGGEAFEAHIGERVEGDAELLKAGGVG